MTTKEENAEMNTTSQMLITLIAEFLMQIFIWALPDLSQPQKTVVAIDAAVIGIVAIIWTLLTPVIAIVVTVIGILAIIWTLLTPVFRKKPGKKKALGFRLLSLFTVVVLIVCVVVTLPKWSPPDPSPTPTEPTSTSTPTEEPTPMPSGRNLSTLWIPPENATPSKSDLESVNTNKSYPNDIVCPKPSSYLLEYETMYVNARRGHSIFLFWAPNGSDRRDGHYVYQGNAVTVLAREGDFSCIIYIHENGGYPIAGWVVSDNLEY